MSLEKKLNIAKEAVLQAKRIILSGFEQKDFSTQYKSDGSPATKIDVVVEELIKFLILDQFPTNSFSGEETSPVNGSDIFRWYCDPVDGTYCMINGEKTFSVSLALRDNEKIVLGVVYNPLTNELFAGADGIPTTLNDKRIPQINKTDSSRAVYNVQISPKRKEDLIKLYTLWEKKDIGKIVSRGGSLAYNLAQVAEGSHSSYIYSSTKRVNEWDIAGGAYLVKSVGGMVDQLDEGKIIIASTNSEIHKKTQKLLAEINFGK